MLLAEDTVSPTYEQDKSISKCVENVIKKGMRPLQGQLLLLRANIGASDRQQIELVDSHLTDR